MYPFLEIYQKMNFTSAQNKESVNTSMCLNTCMLGQVGSHVSACILSRSSLCPGGYWWRLLNISHALLLGGYWQMLPNISPAPLSGGCLWRLPSLSRALRGCWWRLLSHSHHRFCPGVVGGRITSVSRDSSLYHHLIIKRSRGSQQLYSYLTAAIVFKGNIQIKGWKP